MAESAHRAARQQELARLMLAKARQDLRAVARLASDATIADETIGFHLQQTVEESLKAVLIRLGLDYAFTHDLAILAGQVAEAGIEAPTEIDEIAPLTPFAVQFRYSLLEELDVLDRNAGALLAHSYLNWAHAFVEASDNAAQPPDRP
jgi:HEPN domain-containing protein